MSKPKVERWAVLAGEDIEDLIRKWWGKECTDHQSRVIVQIIMHCSGLAKKTSLTRTELREIIDEAIGRFWTSAPSTQDLAQRKTNDSLTGSFQISVP